jgi:quercetin dioxygenase-like cupin family protein
MGPEPDDTRENATDIRYGERVGAPLIDFDLNRELESLRAGDSYRTSDHGAVTLVKRLGLRVVLIAIRAGGHMEEHQAQLPITVQVLAGRIQLEAEGGGIELAPGRLMAIAGGIPHGVVGVEDSAFVLTIGG